jgi:MFS family permease
VDSHEKKTLRMVTVAHALVHLIEGAVPPLIPLLLVAFGANYFQMGLVVTVFAYAFGLGAFPAGILVDRIGPKRLLVLYLFGSAFFCISVFFVREILFFGIIMGFLGLLGSVYHPAANTLISLGIQEKGKAFGINGISGSLGTAAVPFLAAWLGSRLGWKAPHVLFGAAAVIVGFYALSVPSARREKTNGGALPEEAPERKINIPLLVLFYISVGFAGMGSRGVLTFLPTYLGRRISVGGAIDAVTLGGISATITLLAGAAGQYAAGHLVDKHRPDKLYAGTLIIAAASVLLMAMGNGYFILAGALGFAFFSFGYQPMQNYMVTKLIPKKRHGAGYGVMFFMGFGVGSLAAVFSGYLADRYGLASLFFAMTACYIVSFITALGVLKMESRLPGSYI